MSKVERKSEIFSEEEKKKFVEEIITFFKEERDEEIGIVAAGKVLDFFLENVSVEVYNKAIENSAEFLKSKFEDLALDMEVLLKK
jgi:uncharacterized protein (DUF2164 family)